MQTLYIFGNGFDIAHGIRTPYAAFREFLKENHESFLTTFESMYNIQPLDDTEPWYTKEAQERWDKSVINDLWWSFEEKIGHPDVEGMYDSAYSMVDTMPVDGIIDTMNVYWREQYGFVDKLQKYVLEWLQTIDTSQAMCKKDSLINNRNDLFMSFNYTDTLEKVYGIKDVLHLHGGIPSCCEIEIMVIQRIDILSGLWITPETAILLIFFIKISFIPIASNQDIRHPVWRPS